MSVSIIVPVYNSQKYVAETVQSILAQTSRPNEIILIDDGSKDDSLRIIRKLEKISPLIKIYSQKNLGPAITRNRGVQYATSEWICFVDADDLLHPQRIEVAMHFTSQSDVVISDLIRFREVKNLKYPKYYKDQIVVQSTLQSKKTVIKRGFGLPCTLIKKSVFLSAGGINENLVNYEDHEFHFRLLAKGIDVLKIDCPLYFYRQHDGVTRLTRSSSRISKTYDALYYMVDQIESMPPEIRPMAKSEIGNRLANNALKDAISGSKSYKDHLSFARFLNPNLRPYRKNYLNKISSILGYGRIEEFMGNFK